MVILSVRRVFEGAVVTGGKNSGWVWVSMVWEM